MKSIVIRIKYLSDEDRATVQTDDRTYSSVFRYSFNRLIDGLNQKETYKDCRDKWADKLNSHIVNSANREAVWEFSTFKIQQERFYQKEENRNKKFKRHFGQQLRYQRGLITKEEFKHSRMRGLFSEGEANQHGNRFFVIDLDNNEIIYKRSCHQHIHFQIAETLSKKRFDLLQRISTAMRTKAAAISIRVKQDNIVITFDETKIESFRQLKNLRKNRILGLDLNPNYVGLSVIDCIDNFRFNVIHKRVYDLSKLQAKASTNKARFELNEIGCEIVRLCKHFQIGKVAVEDLTISPKNHKRGKSFNKLINNKWRKSQFVKHLKLLCSTYAIDFAEINPTYSSVCGNLAYGDIHTPDMVAAAIEIARRSYSQFEKGTFYPPFNKERIEKIIGNQWKEELLSKFNSWKGLFQIMKESKLRYRFQLSDCSAVSSHDYSKKLIAINIFDGL